MAERAPARQALDLAVALTALSGLLLDDETALCADKRLGLGVLLASLAQRADALAEDLLTPSLAA